jgi:hypothetical protein
MQRVLRHWRYAAFLAVCGMLWDGVIAAQKQDMPILLWAMNGHPLACT